MMNVLAILGITYIVTRSWLFERVRNLEIVTKREWTYTLMRCNQCMSVWTGVLYCLILQMSFASSITVIFAASAIAYALDKFREDIERDIEREIECEYKNKQE